jgi:RNA polymerase sigma-70 factor (sigma-E family)
MDATAAANAAPMAWPVPAPDGAVGVGNIDFEALFEAHHAHLIRLAGLMTGSADVAQDVVADVFAQLLRRPNAAIDDPRAYLRRCVVNEVRSRGRRLSRRARLSSRIEVGSGSSSGFEEPHAERDRIVAALLQLPARQRHVLVLRHFEDLSEAQTASILGIPAGTVKSTSARGAARLRELLGEEGS